MPTQGFIGTLSSRDDSPIRAVAEYRDRLAREMEALEAGLTRTTTALVVARRVLAHEPGAVTPAMALAMIDAAIAWDREAAAQAEADRLTSLAAGYQTAEREDWTGAVE